MNPWTKNPALSLWLSGANAVLGAARSRATAEMHRQTAAVIAESTKHMIRFWSGASMAPPTRTEKARRSSFNSRKK